MSAEHLDAFTRPLANEQRFCPYHGGWILLADCIIVATDPRFNNAAGAGTPTKDEPGVAVPDELDARFVGVFGPPTARSSKPPTATERSAERTLKRMQADMFRVGEPAASRIDGQKRLVLAVGEGYVKRLFRSPKPLKTPAERTVTTTGPVARPARACPLCRHPLPSTIDYRDAYPIALVGHTEASKTSTVIALIEEANRRESRELAVDRLMPTEATMQYLMSLRPPAERKDPRDVFTRFRAGDSVGLTDPGARHPPLELLTTLGTGGPSISLLLHDVAGEILMDRRRRLHEVPVVLWSDVVLFLYNPYEALHPPPGRPGQAAILNGIRDDLEERGPVDASGTPYKDPPLIVAVSKADLLSRRYDVEGGRYTDADVKQALRELGDGAVINAAERFPYLHWRFLAPAPPDRMHPQGVVRLFQLLIQLLIRQLSS